MASDMVSLFGSEDDSTFEGFSDTNKDDNNNEPKLKSVIVVPTLGSQTVCKTKVIFGCS